jgi:crotonobetainyl-CoA:carnitine CoA-transferase CaiB-like acyl-CoA transferase
VHGPVREVGPLAHFRRTPSRIVVSAPAVGTGDATFVARPCPPVPDPSAVRWPRAALDGVTIVDFGYFYAMPYGSAMAALLGARVIKLEDGAGDPHRRSFGKEVASVKTMTGKESLSVDLRTREGQEAAQAVIAGADAFVLGFRPGVAEKLGLDWDTLSAINPRLLYLHAAGYGVDGPYARRALYAQAAQAVGGSFGRQVGYWSNPALNVHMSVMELQAVVAPRLGQVVDGDSNAALAVLAALGLGLYEQRRSGRGQFVAMSMIGANALAYSDDFCTYAGKPKVPVTDEECFGLDALQRVYDTGTGWVCVVVPTQKEWEALCAASGHAELAGDPRFATPAARRANDDALVAAMASLLRVRSATEWEAVLSVVDVGCVAVPSVGQGAFTAFDPGLRDAGLTVETPHPVFGSVVQFGPHVKLSKTPGAVRPAALRGQHNRALLREVGYDDARIDALEAAGVITPPEVVEGPA